MASTRMDEQELQPGIASSPARPVEVPRPWRVALVAVDFDAPSGAALQRASRLRAALGIELRVVHAVPADAAANAMGGSDRLSTFCAPLARWAAQQADVPIPQATVRVEYGQTLEVILRQASRPDVDVVVLGGRRDGDGKRKHWMHELLRRCRKPLLVVLPQGASPTVVAASDGSDASLSMLRRAAGIAAGTGKQLSVVMNMPPFACHLTERISAGGAAALERMAARRVSEGLGSLGRGAQIVTTREAEAARGWLRASQILQSDLLIVQSPSAGDKLPHCADTILDACERSVLFIPVSAG